MEIGAHKFDLTFTNKSAAEKAKQITADTLNAMSFKDYAFDPAEAFVNSLKVEKNTLASSDVCLIASDFMETAAAVIKAIAMNLKTEGFTFDAFGEDTYSESRVNGRFENGILSITSTYYPSGYYEFIPCPECGEDVVSLEDYDSSKTYICPECGEEIDLSKMFEEVAPVITKETIEVK